MEVTRHWEEVRAEWHKESILIALGSSTVNSTLTPELQEAEVFIMDSKRCDQIHRKKSIIPHTVPLVLRDTICATSYGENLCAVSFWQLLSWERLLGREGQLLGERPARPPSVSPSPGSALLPFSFPGDSGLPDVLGWGPQLRS